MKMNKKLIVATAACAALLVGSISTSLAWLLDTTDTVTNKFNPSTLGVTLTESQTTQNVREYDMVPGWTYTKDPIVTVAANSEPCYVFLKVEKSQNLEDYLAYTFDNSTWKKLAGVEGVDNVYFTKYETTSTNAITYPILLGGTYTASSGTEIEYSANQVVVKSDVTKEMMEALNSTALEFKFTAYASQLMKNATTEFTVQEAWANVKDNPSNPSATTTNP